MRRKARLLMAEEEGPTTIRRVVPVGRGDGVVAVNVYHADAVTSASAIRQLARTVAARSLQLAIVRGERDEARAELAALEAAGPRRRVLRQAVRCEWLGAALATVATWLIVARSRLGPACDALYQGGPIERRIG